jgi:hypothetical protein
MMIGDKAQIIKNNHSVKFISDFGFFTQASTIKSI